MLARFSENYVGLVTKLAVKYWKALPVSAKIWVDVDDLINDGMLFARFEVMPYYDIATGNSFTTILTIALRQFYGRRIRDLGRQKRNLAEILLPIDENTFITPDHDGYDVIRSRYSMLKLYDTASPKLQRFIRSWFLNKSSPARIRVSGFTKAKREFLELAPKFKVDINDCRVLLEDRKRKALS